MNNVMEALLNIKVTTDNKDKSSIDKQAQHSKEIDKNLKRASNTANDIFSSLLGIFSSDVMLSFAKTIKDTTKELINLSAKQIEYQNNLITLKVAFGETTNEAENFADALAETIGFDKKDLVKSLALYRQYGNAMGYASDKADLLARNLVKMQLDLTAVYKDTDTYAVNFQRMGNALQNALTGQVKTIRGITGADITEATLEQTRLTLGITKTVKEMTRAEKTILIYLSLEQNLANTNGALANTINSVSNQTAIFTSQIEVAKRQLGQLAYWILEKVLPVVNGLLMVFNELVGILVGFLGINTKEADSFWASQKKGVDGYNSAVEKANKQLRSFDKLNNISANDNSGIGGGFGGNISDEFWEHLKEYDLHLNEMNNKATKIRDKIFDIIGLHKELNYETLQWEWKYDGIKTTISNLYNEFKKLSPTMKYLVGSLAVIGGIKTFRNIKNLIGLIPKSNNSLGKLVQSLKLVDKWDTQTVKSAIELWTESLTPMQKVNNTLVGGGGIVVGLSLVKDGANKMREEGVNAFNSMETAGGLFASTIGGALIGATYGGIGGGILGAIAGGVIGLAEAFADTTTKVEDYTIGQLIPSLQSYETELENAKEKTEQLTTKYDEQSNIAKGLSDRLGDLIDSNGKVDTSTDKAKRMVELLNEQLGIQLKLDDDQLILDGKLIKTKDDLTQAIDRYCEKLRIEGYLEAFRQEYITRIGEQKKAQEEYNKIMDEVIKSQENYDLTTQEGYKQWVIDNADKIKKLNELDSLIKTNEDKLSNYEKAGYEATQGNYDKAYEYLTKHSKDVEVSYNDTVNSILKNNDTIAKDIKEKAGLINKQNTIWSIDIKLNDKGEVINKLTILKETLAKTGGYNSFGSGGNVGFRADGGFVRTGEVFVARENGLTEMVGNIGGHTAVANNDQIVEGITVGVARGMAQANNNQTVVISAEGDASGLLDFITFKQKEQQRQYGL